MYIVSTQRHTNELLWLLHLSTHKNYIISTAAASILTKKVKKLTKYTCLNEINGDGDESSATAEGPREVLCFTSYGSKKFSSSKSDLQGHSRSLAMVPFDRPHTISY